MYLVVDGVGSAASNCPAGVRRQGTTYANCVGTPLLHSLATLLRPDDTGNPLRAVYGDRMGVSAGIARRPGWCPLPWWATG